MGNDEQGYNGYTNRETWTVSLWLDNDEGQYNYWTERAESLKDSAEDFDQVLCGMWTEKNAVLYKLADEIEANVREGAPSNPTPGTMYSDLTGWALCGVNWQEVAESFTAELWD